jgi:hypothetical protein
MLLLHSATHGHALLLHQVLLRAVVHPLLLLLLKCRV